MSRLTASYELDPESLRQVLDGAYERLQAMKLRTDDPRRVAFEEVAAAVAWTWYPEQPSRP